MSVAQDKGESSEFITKLMDMMSTYSNIVGWSEDGSELVVKDVRKAIENVLPKYFRHCKFESFVRQLNMYNFHKINREKNNTVTFKNEHFFRGNEAGFGKIKRKRKVDNRNKMPELLEENLRFVQRHPSLDVGSRSLLSMLLNFKFSCYFEVRKLTDLVLKVAEELKGVKLKRAQPHLNQIRSVIEKMDEKDEEVEGLLRCLKTGANISDETSSMSNKAIDMSIFQNSINSYLEGAPITNTIIEPLKVQKIEVEHFKSCFKLHSFRSITSFIDVCKEPMKVKEEDKESNFSLELNEDENEDE